MNKLLLLIVVLGAGSAAAETRSLTLRDAVRLALERNPDVLLAQVRREKAEHGVAVAKSAFSGFASVGSGPRSVPSGKRARYASSTAKYCVGLCSFRYASRR